MLSGKRPLSNTITITATHTYIAGMISAAKERSMEEIMLEILDGNEIIYHVLREDAASVTPQDITWVVPLCNNMRYGYCSNNRFEQ